MPELDLQIADPGVVDVQLDFDGLDRARARHAECANQAIFLVVGDGQRGAACERFTAAAGAAGPSSS